MRVVKFLQNQTVVVREHSYQILTVSQYDFSDGDLSGLFHHFSQQRIRLLRNRSVRSGEIWCIVEGGWNFRAVNKAYDIHSFCSLDLYLCDVVRLNDGVTIGLVLVALRNLVIGDYLVAFLAPLVVTDGPIIFSVELIERNFFAGLDCVVDAYRDGN